MPYHGDLDRIVNVGDDTPATITQQQRLAIDVLACSMVRGGDGAHDCIRSSSVDLVFLAAFDCLFKRHSNLIVNKQGYGHQACDLDLPHALLQMSYVVVNVTAWQ